MLGAGPSPPRMPPDMWNWRVYTFLSGSQWMKNFFFLSISTLGILNATLSYGSAATIRYWYRLSQASSFCSKLLMNRCRGTRPSSISG